MTSSKSLFSCAVHIILSKIIPKLEVLTMLPILGMRLWVANVFWKAGLTKIDNWETTLFLFEEEYAVPLLPTEVAAYLGTAGELIAPVLIAFGFGARAGAFVLLIMTAVIEFTYQSFPAHQVWALILLMILFYGPGRISLDHFVRKYFNKG
jgi:putative oxidoreductase